MTDILGDGGCVQILKILQRRDATTPEIRDRTNLNIKQVKYRLRNKLNDLVEVVGKEKPQQGGTATDVWSLSTEGEELVRQKSLKQDLTIEELRDEVEKFRSGLEQTEEELKTLKSRVSDRATHSKVDRTVEQVEEQIQDLQQTVEFVESRARREAEREASEQVTDMKSTLEERLNSFREQEIREVKTAIRQLEDTQSGRDERIRRLERQIDEKNEEIEELEQRLSDVENRTLTDLLF